MRVRLCAVAGVLAMLLPAGAARARNLFTLDSGPASAGHLAEDGAGTAYVAWVHHAAAGDSDYAMFCKIPNGGRCTSPVALPIPDASPGDPTKGVTGAFPILDGTTVFVVAPRYVQDDVILYESISGGPFTSTTFPSSTTPGAGPYSNKTDPSNVFLRGDTFVIAADNAGLGFSEFGAHQGNFTFTDPQGTVADSTMGLDSSGKPVIAYYNLASGAQDPILFYRFNDTMPPTGIPSAINESNWSANPVQAASGQEPRLAGGPSGLLMAANEYPSSASTVPTLLTVRKWGGTGFGAPLVLTNDKSTGLFDGGAAVQTPGGHVLVAWPTARAGDLEQVMRLYISTNGGASFGGHVDIAKVGDAYASGDNAQLAGNDNGQGWITFRDSRGLEVADFNPVPAYVPPPYKGPTKTGTAKAPGGIRVTLKVPAKCVAASQKFNPTAGLKVKHRRGRKVSIKKVVFSLDGHTIKTRRHKPFSATITIPAGASHSVHTIKATITFLIKRAHHKPRTLTRTVKVKVPIC